MREKIKTYREIIIEEILRVHELHGEGEYWNKISGLLIRDLVEYEELEKF